jgi:hypothetical protein
MTEEMNGLAALGDSHMDAYAPIEDLAEDYEFFGLDAFITPEMMKTGLIAGASGAGGILAVMNIFDRIEYFADKPKGRALAEAVTGLVGGYALWKVNRDAAMGFAGGVSGYALAGLINQYVAEMQTEETPTEGLAYTEVQQVPGYRKLDRTSVPAGWGQGRAPMAGLGRDIVTRANYEQIHGLEAGDVGAWVT